MPSVLNNLMRQRPRLTHAELLPIIRAENFGDRALRQFPTINFDVAPKPQRQTPAPTYRPLFWRLFWRD
jgi:hypothetical protein